MPNLTGRQTLLIAASVLGLLSLTVGMYGLVRGPSPHSSPSVDSGDPGDIHRVPTSPLPRRDPDEDRSLPHTIDPIEYAEAVARALFVWDTTTGLTPADVSAPVVADAAPAGQETVGLLTDIATYLPTDRQWMDLARLQVSQDLEVTSAEVPGRWPTIVATSRGQLGTGSAAVTIEAIRHREGTWNGAPATSSYDVAFTVFMACPPIVDRCRVLRLSQLDKPLR